MFLNELWDELIILSQGGLDAESKETLATSERPSYK